MSKFYSTEFVLDIATPTDSTHSPKDIVTSFYQFVIKRYYLKHIALLVLHDLISALERHHQENVVSCEHTPLTLPFLFPYLFLHPPSLSFIIYPLFLPLFPPFLSPMISLPLSLPPTVLAGICTCARRHH